MSQPKLMRTASRGVIPAPDVLRQRLAHPEWFHIQEKNGVTNVTVNVLRLPAPERSLVASVTAVAASNREVSIIFGQLLPGATRMHGALCVDMSSSSVRQVLYSSDEFLTELDRFADRHGIVATLRQPDGNSYPQERVVMERASMAAISFSEYETELRFYRTSATEIRMITHEKAGQASVVHGVVEILMSTEELVHLIHSLRQAVPREEAP